MSDSIRLSPKHGVNPTCGRCFWCGELDGTVLLLGHLPGDQEAGPSRVYTYEPCPSCAEQWKRGFPLLEVTSSPNGQSQPPLTRDPRAGAMYPTGNMWVIRTDAAEQLFPEHVVRAGRCCLSPETARALGLHRSES